MFRLDAELVEAALRVADLLRPLGSRWSKVERQRAIRADEPQFPCARFDLRDARERDPQPEVRAAKDDLRRLEQRLAGDGVASDANGGLGFQSHDVTPARG